MNSAVFYSSKTDMWATPQDFFDALDAEFHFTLDACAVKENAKCEAYYTPEQDGLDQPCHAANILEEISHARTIAIREPIIKEPPWRAATEQPPHNRRVEVCCDPYGVTVGFYDAIRKEWRTGDYCLLQNVTRWRPLPAPQKEVNDDE